MLQPLVTLVVPSLNQGDFLEEALASIFQQNLPVEVFVMDGGSSDNSVELIKKWAPRLAGWRSHADNGQSAAINEGMAMGTAPYVCWLNSDDFYLTDGLKRLVDSLEAHPEVPAVYGRVWNMKQGTKVRKKIRVENFDEARLAFRCIISQPGVLIRRSAWEAVHGLDESLHLAMDYDLWWRLYREFGPLFHLEEDVAVNREHDATKTKTQRRNHYREAISVVRQHYGRVPIKWWLAQPYAVWYKTLVK